MIEKKERINNLLDLYGSLLTDHQRELCEIYYSEDLSLQEIADNFNISRNAVFDNIKRAEALLEEYESKLKLLEKEDNFIVLVVLKDLNLISKIEKSLNKDYLITKMENEKEIFVFIKARKELFTGLKELFNSLQIEKYLIIDETSLFNR